jgi:CRP-like cAMP-binding protein
MLSDYGVERAMRTTSALGNWILRQLPEEDFRRLAPNLQPIDFEPGQVFYEPMAHMGCAYFLERGLVSVVSMMENGSSSEVALIGNEGMIGLPILLGIDDVPCQYVAQVPGSALEMKADVLKDKIRRGNRLRSLLLRYLGTFLTQLMQVSACNRLHSVEQRSCRWLLMYQDRVHMKDVPLTHEFLARLLGVRRASVTDVLHPLQEAGLISYRRGKITVVDRDRLEAASCECYRIITGYYDRMLAGRP